MPNKCGVANCKGNYNSENKCRVFRIPRDTVERQRWLDALPPRENFVVDPAKFFICEKHWPTDPLPPMIKLTGGCYRPSVPPSVFNVPVSCLPIPKSTPRPPKQADKQLSYFLKKDKITSLADFSPEKELYKKYEHLVISKTSEKFLCLFMSENYEDCLLSVVVSNKSTLCSPLVLTAYKSGITVPLGKLLNPNNGLASYSQFFECVHTALNYDIPIDDVMGKVVGILEDAVPNMKDEKKEQKLDFLTHQLRLLAHKQFNMNDYCFAIECYPRCSYEHLRDFLVLPSTRKIRSVVSNVDIESVLIKTFNKLQRPQQKNVLLLIDEVKIRPTVAFSGGILNGMAKNNPDIKATAMLCVMIKCLHKGPRIMFSVTPVSKLTAQFQHDTVINAAAIIERTGGIVLGSITDNHKVNQHYTKLFERSGECDAIVKHPLDNNRDWFLLFDTVHLLKCIRNNWISEKEQKLSFDTKCVGSFLDVKRLYEAEKNNILKTTPLTQASVTPSKLQLQNVKLVLRVFNEKVVAALKIQGCEDTASFIEFVLNWWNTMNVSAKGQDIRLRDPHRAVQTLSSTSLDSFTAQFENAGSGHGPSRIQCLTHDTRKALIQTMRGLSSISKHLLTHGQFEYVLLREIQSDRIEGEFSVYRQSTGANAFMTSGDVVAACKQRLARYAASYLQSLDTDATVEPQMKHTCYGPLDVDDAASIEKSISEVKLSINEETCCAYVAGWLERKCEKEIQFEAEEPLVQKEVSTFIEEVSRGGLSTPHQCTYELLRVGLCFVKKTGHREQDIENRT